MTPLLLDANLSPETAAYLRATFGFDVLDLTSLGMGRVRDPDVIALAQRLGRVIVTFDLDFAELYHRRDRGGFGVVVLRLGNQTVESVNRALDRFFRFDAVTISLDGALIVVHEERSRVVHPC